MRDIEIEVGRVGLVKALVNDKWLAPLGALDEHLLPGNSQRNCHTLPLHQPAHQRPLLVLLELEGFHLRSRPFLSKPPPEKTPVAISTH